MRVVIDLDGTICYLKQKHESYSEVLVKPGAVEFIDRLRGEGHYVIIQTARNMATCESNLGRVMKNVGKETLDWLQKHNIFYDEIYFGKPNANLYIDDRALRFEDWESMSVEKLETLAREK